MCVFCGAPPESQAPQAPVEDVQFQQLSAAELQKFMTAFPIFRAELEKKGEKWERLAQGQTFTDWLQKYTESNKDIAELDAKLKTAGTSWADFVPTMAKTTLAMVAVMMDSMRTTMKEEVEEAGESMAELEAKLNDPSVPEQQKSMIKAQLDMIKGMQESLKAQDTVYAKVPQQNKDLIKAHWNELMNIFGE
jgi:molybdopterin converting factor small subunit